GWGGGGGGGGGGAGVGMGGGGDGGEGPPAALAESIADSSLTRRLRGHPTAPASGGHSTRSAARSHLAGAAGMPGGLRHAADPSRPLRRASEGPGRHVVQPRSEGRGIAVGMGRESPRRPGWGG